MTITGFDADGLLPVGVHDCTIDEIEHHFGAFRSSDWRPKVFEKLRSYIDEMLATGHVAAVIVDGSFVTAKDRPNDADLVVVLRADADRSAPLPPYVHTRISSRWVREHYGLDIFVAHDGTQTLDNYIAFYQEVPERPELRKGILRVSA
jgi:hypothetical protein